MALSELKLRSHAITLAGRKVAIQSPADPDQILTRVIESGPAEADDPYWSLLWPAATKTAEVIVRHPWPAGHLSTLEIGCGAGLAGVAALLCGHDVVFTDVVEDAVELAISNARLNGFPAAEGFVMDWRHPVERKFDLIVGSDVLYEASNHDPLLQLMDCMLATEGQIWIGDTGRGNAMSFVDTAREQSWNLQILNENGTRLHQPERQQFQIFNLRRHHD